MLLKFTFWVYFVKFVRKSWMSKTWIKEANSTRFSFYQYMWGAGGRKWRDFINHWSALFLVLILTEVDIALIGLHIILHHENERYFFLILLSSMGGIFCYTELIYPISLRSVPEWEFLYYSERNFLTWAKFPHKYLFQEKTEGDNVLHWEVHCV